MRRVCGGGGRAQLAVVAGSWRSEAVAGGVRRRREAMAGGCEEATLVEAMRSR
jgi:hypothetical protein